MCKFFSFIQSEKGFFYFNGEQRKLLITEEPDSHYVIARFFLGNGAEDYCNKYEYTNGVLVVDQLNNKLLLKEDAEAFIKKLVASKEWEKICLAAVKQDGYALEFVNEQTAAICLAAVKQDVCALKYVKEQTEKICLAAVKQNGFALQYVNEQTEKICLAAVKQNWCALKYVKAQTEKICLAAVEQAGYALQYVKVEFKSICEAYIRERGGN